MRVGSAHLLKNDSGAWFVSPGGQGDGCGQDERAAQPGVRAKMFAEELDAEPGAKGRLDV